MVHNQIHFTQIYYLFIYIPTCFGSLGVFGDGIIITGRVSREAHKQIIKKVIEINNK